jgi:hypothetical protein
MASTLRLFSLPFVLLAVSRTCDPSASSTKHLPSHGS